MNILKKIIMLIAVLSLGIGYATAQTTIQSNGAGGGSWDADTTWSGGVVPGDLDSVVILSGDSVWLPVSDTCAGLAILTGAKLATYAKLVPTNVTLNGALTAYADTFYQSGAMTVGDGGVYNHAMNGGRIPTGLWEAGSTFLVTGLIGNTPSNGNQNFYNVTWNCPNQTSNLNLGWDSVIIGGDITMLRSGTFPNFLRWNLTAPLSLDSSTLTIMGDIIVRRGALSSNGTSNGNSRVTIFHHGNIIIDGEDPSRDSANFSVSRGSQGGTGTTRWYLYGNVTLNNATSQNSNPNGARFVFVNPATQTLTINPNCNIMAFPLEVVSGTTLDVGTSTIRGNGKVFLDSAATLICANPGGMDSLFTSTLDTLKIFNSAVNFTFNGTSAQVTGRTMPGTVNNLTINNPAGVTLSDSVIVNGALSIVDGDCNTDVNLITLGGSAVLSESPGQTVVGMIGTSRDVAQGADESFGGIGLTINAAGAAPGITNVLRVTGTPQIYYTNQSIARYFEITPTVNASLNATLDYFYDDSELNGQNASTLQLWKSTDDGAAWDDVISEANAGLKRVRASGVNSFSRFTAADDQNPLAATVHTYSMNALWNIVSLPLIVADPQKTSLFPTAVSNAFAYSGAYVVSSTLESGSGYWLKFGSAQDVNILGAELLSDTISLNEGWNMIGSITDTVPVAGIEQNPPGIVISPYYAYSSGYTNAANLIPSKGYWVKAGVGGGEIILSSGSFAKTTQSETNALHNFNSITVTDNNGGEQTLYIGSQPGNGFNVNRYELPPSPPAGALDVRFASQRFVEIYPQEVEQGKEFAISVRSAAFPVTVRWNITDESKKFTLSGFKSAKQQMKAQGSVVINDPVSLLALNVSGMREIPKEFALSENYPNPFNPSTKIDVDLPVESYVSLRVFNLLGEQVAELASGLIEGGRHTFSWKGTTDAGVSVSSGVYFYKLETSSVLDGQKFSAIHKMVLMK